MTAEVEIAIAQRSAHMPAQRPHWDALAAEYLGLAGDAPQLIADWLLHVPDLAAGRRLLGILGRAGDPAVQMREFQFAVEQSEQSLASWLSALDVLARKLQSTPHRPDLRRLRGYLECCSSIIESGPRYSDLPMTVDTLFELFGFDPEP